MEGTVELLRVGAEAPDDDWGLGPSRAVPRSPDAILDALRASPTDVEAILLWDATLPRPDPELLIDLLTGPVDAWHAGLLLGQRGRPGLLTPVAPTAMWDTPVDASIASTSWRLTVRATLARRALLDHLPPRDARFDGTAALGLDLGYRWIRRGAIVRHEPALLSAAAPVPPVATEPLGAVDAARFVTRHHGRVWAGWGLLRSADTRWRDVPPALAAIRATPTEPLVEYDRRCPLAGDPARRVSVIVPTLDRYPYLAVLFGGLAEQTVPPAEVIVADQTPLGRRRDDLADLAPGLDVQVLGLDAPGQSTARNRAIAASSGELLLFVDDDDEIGPTLIEDHLRRLADGIDASCGGVDDATAGPPPPGFRHRRASDVFPTNNTMLRREALRGSGLFDPAFDHGPRADRDLGVRLHRSGAVLVYDPTVRVFHNHASTGGLRSHDARRITRAGARRSLTVRNPAAPTEMYLHLRHFTPEQQRHAGTLHLLTTLSGDGPPTRRLARLAVQLVLLPDTVRRLRRSRRAARSLLAEDRPVPALADAERREDAP